MAPTLYIAALEPATGKSVIALGVMEMLAGRIGGAGFFRPIVASRDAPDPLVALFRDRYGMDADPADLCGLDYAEVRTHAGDPDWLVSKVVERFRAAEARFPAMVCLGSDLTGASPAEFALNLRIADNLGAAVLAVVSGEDRTAAEVAGAARMAADAVTAAGNPLVAVVANRVEPGVVAEARILTAGSEPPVYVLAADPALTEPTVGEVAAATGARLVLGDPAELDRDVRGVLVGAATLPAVLDLLRDGTLVLTPGDRDDVVVGMLAAAASATAPHASGLLLTAGLLPDERLRGLLAGLSPGTPVLAVGTDTFTTAQAVAGVQGRITTGSARKISAGLGCFERGVDVPDLARRIEISRSTRVTPLMFEYDLVERARTDRRHIVLPEGTDDRILRATETILRRGVAELTLLGDSDAITRRAAALGLDIGGASIVDPAAPGSVPLRERLAAAYARARAHKGMTLAQARDAVGDVSYFGTLMVHEGLADGMVSGAAHTTAHTIRPAFEVIRTVPGVSTVSSVFLMCLADRVLVYGDCAVIPDPDAGQLADIAISSAATAVLFGIEPRIALLSYSTGESGSGADVDKVRVATKLVRERRPDLPVEGPIQYDAAVDAGVAAAKLPGSVVAGRATVFVFPDLNTGNNTYKAVQRSAGAVAIGPVLQGLRKPVNDLSRGCTVTDVVNTVAITAIQAGQA
ncbi:MAG: phosphate acetyltransferase [Actinomycetia bacterium]|nr:phosphate acetyltransferase [Actinomycetes bacterium]